MNTRKFILFSLSSILALSSCATGFKKSESIEEKMSRFEAKERENLSSPQIPVYDYKFKFRMPTAVEEKGDKKENSPISNKRLYFMTLFTQYNEMRSLMSNVGPKISICPSFHSSLVEFRENHKELSPKEIAWNIAKIDLKKSEKELALYPELFLPLTKEKSEPRVIDLIKRDGTFKAPELFTKAMSIHLLKTYNELVELCETGSSDNYYIFENLIGHNKEAFFSATAQNMNVLLKNPIFSNVALIQSLQKSEKKAGRSIASFEEERYPNYLKDVSLRIKAPWVREYFEETNRARVRP